MTIENLSEEQFKRKLREVLHVSEPIRSFEHLYGREKQLDMIKRALNFPGRHVFIYGDRGVGKTSLAQTAAYQNHPINQEPIILGCQPSSTFQQIMQDIAVSVRNDKKQPDGKKHKIKLGATLPHIVAGEITYEVEDQRADNQLNANQPQDLNASVALLKILCNESGGTLLIVIDEFDRIRDETERKLFADLVKQVSDQEAPVQFIFCGVGHSLDELLAAHESSHRYFEGIPLERLIFQGRYDIIDQSSAALGVTVNDRHRFRIAAISDGFPHYIHLICNHLFWEMFDADHALSETTQDVYDAAIRQAVIGMETQLKVTYNKATLRDDPNYELVLWAAADHGDLQRSTRSIYESYLRIAKSLVRPSVPQQELTSYLRKLKLNNHGHILKMFRRGWYEFSENIVRGYVRLRAEDSGCPLALEYDAGATPVAYTVGTSKAQKRPLPMGRSSFGRIPGR